MIADLLTKGAVATTYMKGVRPALEVEYNFSFVVNVERLADQTPDATLTLAPGHQLRRATDKEVIAIKDVLTNHIGEPDFGAWQNSHPVKEGTTTKRSQLPKDQWRYFVITFEGASPAIVEIERTLCISQVDLKIGFTLLHDWLPGATLPTLIYHSGRLASQTFAARADKLPFLEMTSSVVEKVRLLHEKYRTRDQNLVRIDRLVEQLLDLDALPFNSPLLFLGYFAILESLLTHKPKETDTIDSITRQVKQKVLLLDNRWEPRIDYSPFLGKPDAIWKKMYHYRSDIAHGTEPDFKGDLKLLGDSDRALKLLKTTVKGVLRQTIIEPQLMLDLRNC
jgi:hypothetical protein